MPRRLDPYRPLIHPGYLPELLYRLKSLEPQAQALLNLLSRPRTPSTLAAQAPLLAHLLQLLPQLPEIGDYDLYPPPAFALPQLLVRPTGKAYLSQELIASLNLRAGQPATLHPPMYGSEAWYLDLRPAAPHTIDWYPGKRAKIKQLALPPQLVLPEQGLTLLLLPGSSAYADWHTLIPAPAELAKGQQG